MTIDLWTLPKKKKIEKDDEEETDEEEQSSLERMADRRPTRTSSSVVETPTPPRLRRRPARFSTTGGSGGIQADVSSPLLAQATGQNVTTGGMTTSREETAQEKRQSPFGLRKFSEKKTVHQRRRNSHLARPDGSRFHFSDDEQSSSDGEDEGSDGEDDEDSDKDERTENDNDSDKENSETVSGSTRIDKWRIN